MATSDKWTRTQLRTMVRNELMDPNTKWFTDQELNLYLDEWQQRLQDWFEFVWTTATSSVAAIGTTTSTSGVIIPNGTASILLSTFVPDAVRVDAFYWFTATNTLNKGVRLAPRTKQDLDVLIRDWRYVLPSDPPLVIYQDDITNIVLWPPPANAGTLIAEYPQKLCFVSDADTMKPPAWTKYSANYYCAYRAFMRNGPRQDLQRALAYKAIWERYIFRYRRMWDNYFPTKYPQLKPKQPSDAYNISILNPPYITIIPP